MAKNEHFHDAERLSLPVPAGTKSGDPVVVGIVPGIAETNIGEGGNSATNATVWMKGAHDVPVTGAITTIMQAVYIPTAGGALTATVGSNVLWGYALALKGAGTGTIPVKISQV